MSDHRHEDEGAAGIIFTLLAIFLIIGVIIWFVQKGAESTAREEAAEASRQSAIEEAQKATQKRCQESPYGSKVNIKPNNWYVSSSGNLVISGRVVGGAILGTGIGAGHINGSGSESSTQMLTYFEETPAGYVYREINPGSAVFVFSDNGEQTAEYSVPACGVALVRLTVSKDSL